MEANSRFVLFVNGTLMRGMELHSNLSGAEFLGETMTAPMYRLFSIDDKHPGMFKVSTGGISVKGELYSMSLEVWQRVEAGEPPHLYGDSVHLIDGRVVWGILYPRELAERKHTDISDYGDWRAYVAGRLLT